VITGHTLETLRAFEQLVADDFNAGRIHAPVHLAGGNEEQLIEIFRDVHEEDWVLTQWRSHYHCLLKGIPPERLREDILAGRSITLCYPEHRILSSAIVGGVLPIAVGIAMAIRREREAMSEAASRAYDSHLDDISRGDMDAQGLSYDDMVVESNKLSEPSERVWVFIGDMTASTGTFAECFRYVSGYDLPVHFVVEDNGRSVCTDTASVWGLNDRYRMNGVEKLRHITRFCYELPWPHSGAGKRIEF